nr:class I SAM-dependent methyltransferase [Chroococcidiopsis sp. TS-821]
MGTQALELATLGHNNVTASDLFAAVVAQARKETRSRELEMTFKVADMRQCAQTHGVLSTDNSLLHLSGDNEIGVALQSFYQCLRQDGVAIVSLGEYLEDEEIWQ